MANHLTPEELCKEFNLKREEVIRLCHEQSVPIYDMTGHRSLYPLHARAELKPASNMKLTTAATVLADIGAGARLTTRVYATGTLSNGTLTGSLWLVGDGDPSLSVGAFRRRAF